MTKLRSLFHRGYHNLVNRDDLYKLIQQYRESQYWSTRDLKVFQQKKLESLISYAYKSVPYYRRLFNKTGISPAKIYLPDNFSKVPFLTKDIIRENLEELVSNSINDKYLRQNATSGSTGSNLNFFSDKSSYHAQAINFRNQDWMGLDYFDRKITIWGAPWDIKKSRQLVSSIKQKIKGNVVLSGYQLSDEMIMNYHKRIIDYKPRMIRSYPSILYLMALYYERNNLRFQPEAIESAGEKLHLFQREKIEQIFNTKIFDFYGSRDIPLIAQECEEHHGLHVMIENVFLEVVNEDGEPIEEGEGDLVLTHLNNRAMPFIRYIIGDRARISKRNCSCGRNLPLIEEVIGRTFEVIEFPNGKKVGGTFWTFVMKSARGFKDFQVIQNSINHITINYIPEFCTAINESINTVRRNILEYSGQQLKIDFIEVSEIQLSRGGKYQFVTTKVKKS